MPFMPQRDRSAWAEAAKVKAAHHDAVERIRSRRDLSEAGRRRQIAKVTVTARDRLAQLKADDEQRLAARHAELEGKLFRPTDTSPAGQLLALDAATRAAQITNPAQCQRLLATAQRLGNSTLAQAVAQHAVDLADADPTQAANYWQIVHTWADTVPFAGDHLAELGQMDVEQLDPMARFARSTYYRHDTAPEINGAGNLDVLAQEADDVDDTIQPTARQSAGPRLAAGVYNDGG